MFALHGGSASSGLAMHLKVDYTPVADREGFVVAYPSGTEGWNNGVAHKYTGGVTPTPDRFACVQTRLPAAPHGYHWAAKAQGRVRQVRRA